MIKLTPVISLLMLCLFASASFAQTGIAIGTTMAMGGDNVCVPVTVTAGGQAHNNASVNVTFSTPLSNLSQDSAGSIYTSSAFNLTGNVAQSQQTPTITTDGLAYSLCFDVDMGAAPGTYPIGAAAGPFTGLFNGAAVVSADVTPGSVTVVPEPNAIAMVLAAALVGMIGFRTRRK